MKSLFHPYITLHGDFVEGIKIKKEMVGMREPIEEKFLSLIPLKGKIVYDIGAYTGKYTVAFARRAEFVYAFEPNRLSFEELNKTLSRNGCFNVSALNICLGNAPAEKTLIIPPSAGCATIDEGIAAGFGNTFTQKVLIKRLDDLDIDAPDFIKIDVEGSELAVLQGAEKLLEKKPELYIELHGNGPAGKLKNIRAVVNFLKKWEYALYAVEKETGINTINYADARFSHLFCYA